MKILSSLPKKAKSPNFIGFISALSLYALGGALFLEFQKEPQSLQRDGNHRFSLKLASIDSGGNQTIATKTPSKPKPKKKVEKHTKAQKSISQPEKIETKEKEEEHKASNITQDGGEIQTLAHNEGVSNEFLSKIHLAISSYNPYPRMARIRKMEGEVILEFILNVNGELEGVKILSSTASDLLNQSAIKAVYRASRDFPLPTQRVKIKVPIIYSLRA